jgi:hypothetical protein
MTSIYTCKELAVQCIRCLVAGGGGTRREEYDEGHVVLRAAEEGGELLLLVHVHHAHGHQSTIIQGQHVEDGTRVDRDRILGVVELDHRRQVALHHQRPEVVLGQMHHV